MKKKILFFFLMSAFVFPGLAGWQLKVDATQNDQPPACEILEHFGVQGLLTFVILHPIYE